MINPELRRNFWLELTSTRLILIPILLGMVFLISYLIDRTNYSISNNYFESTRNVARIAFFILAFLWGTKAASEALSDEINDHTWDFQRMSPFGAWSMTWGKLIGATSHTWYAAFIALAVMVIADLQVHPPILVLRFVYLMVASALLSHCVAYLISLHAIIKSHTPRRGGIIGFLIFTLPIGLVFSRFASVSNPLFSKVSDTNPHLIQWYGQSYDFIWFTSISLAIFLAWAFYGAYRLMRMELQYQSLPTAWLSFLIYISVYTGGFIPKAIQHLSLSQTTSTLLLAFFITIIFLYLLIFTEPKSTVTYRKLIQAFRAKNFYKLGTLTPCWLVTSLCMLIIGIILLIISPEISLAEWRMTIKAFVISALLFTTRDILIVLIVNIMPYTSRKADQTAMILLVILYILLPFVFLAVGIKNYSYLFFPINDSTSILYAILSPTIQVVVLLAIFRKKWHQNVQLIETS